MNWAARPRDENARTKRYYPNVPKRDLVRRGYIARRSSHSLGTAVDLTIVPSKRNTEENETFTGTSTRTPSHCNDQNAAQQIDQQYTVPWIEVMPAIGKDHARPALQYRHMVHILAPGRYRQVVRQGKTALTPHHRDITGRRVGLAVAILFTSSPRLPCRRARVERAGEFRPKSPAAGDCGENLGSR